MGSPQAVDKVILKNSGRLNVFRSGAKIVLLFFWCQGGILFGAGT
ncbi:hypothetical protein Tfer_0767 [Thermincola ferriacetica]|uniref:Uncharacterized protein n=1 Tax=Thermincola ferriacetica TaxID=281456 RepID=A0A0L6W5E0_9FIRM|nr:hypothetical protein Tfer_0767 [Thermincola ferriacetica]